jgi:DNA-binding NtrC family response regulator
MGTSGFSVLPGFLVLWRNDSFPVGGRSSVGWLIQGVELPIHRESMIRESQPSTEAQSDPALPDTGAEEMQSVAREGYLCLVGGSAAMRTVREQLRRVSAHFRMVLITGEAGTGKEIVARAMHRLSAQPERQFVSGSAASFLSSVPAMLASSHFALRHRPTAIEASAEEAKSTFFLGDVNALTSGEQMCLLDALTRLEGQRSGGERPRLIFATERDLRALSGAGQFNSKLYRKISAVEISLPSLHSRPEDIAVLAAELMGSIGRPVDGKVQMLDKRALTRLEEYGWPGNVRELKRVIELAQIRARGGAIELAHLPPLSGTAEMIQRSESRMPLERLDDVIQNHVLEVLLRCSGNKVRAAERLGISRSTLYRTLENNAAAILERLR